MSSMRCHCGNYVSDSSDDVEVIYYFVSDETLKEHWEDFGFFELQYNELATEMWKCDVCDRMMVFKSLYGYVSKFMKQVDVESVSSEDLSKPYVEGLCCNNLLFHALDRHFAYENKYHNAPEYEFFELELSSEDKPLLTAKVVFEEIFSLKNGKFRDWWFARMYDDCLVLYSPYRNKCSKPVRVWKVYEHVHFDADGKPID